MEELLRKELLAKTKQALDADDWNTVVRLWQPWVEQGDAEAEYQLAYNYLWCTPCDDSQPNDLFLIRPSYCVAGIYASLGRFLQPVSRGACAMVKARGGDSCPGLSHHRASNLLVFIESWSPSGQPVPTAVMEGKQNGRNQDAMLAELMACRGDGERVEPAGERLSGGD